MLIHAILRCAAGVALIFLAENLNRKLFPLREKSVRVILN